MKSIFFIIAALVLSAAMFSCKTTKHINKALSAKDTLTIKSTDDSSAFVNKTLNNLKSHYITFNTFNAKIKVDYEDAKGKQPDVTAIVRIVKDSAIWISLTATILNFEVYRMLITKDSVFIMDKREKKFTLRSIDYLQDISQIPFDFYTLQDLLVGNPIFLDSNVIAYKRTENSTIITVLGKHFKHLLTLSADKNILLHSKLDDINLTRSRTADITYDEFENKNDLNFSTFREITVSEKNKLDIKMKYKQYDFNKNVSVAFSIPKNYTQK
ncbi:MAG: DUF4292 domain-containing protein [Chitinophagaceae bacterium]|nr:DUF4292 domain-containing protein [Chitinophagaceae bacterium]